MRPPLLSRDWDGWMLQHWIVTGVLLGVVISGVAYALLAFVKGVAA